MSMLEKSDLHDYQERMIEYILDRPGAGLFLPVGMGKTTIALSAISELLDEFAVTRVLVIAPIRVCNKTWRQEAAKWAHINHLNVADCTGDYRQRFTALASDADVYLLNPENVVWMIQTFGKRWKWDMIVFDESHLFKSPESKRFRGIQKVLQFVDRRVILTGTPSANGIGDIWAQIFLLDDGMRLYRHVSQFRGLFMKSAGFKGRGWAPRKGSNEAIREKIADITTSLSAEEHLTLPERITVDREVDLPPNVREMYKELEEELIAVFEEDTLMVKTAMSVGIKLRQVCNGAAYNDEKTITEIHDAKIKEVIDLLEDQPDERFILCYQFKHDVERIMKAIPYARLMDKKGDEVDRWNAKQTRLLLLHPASAGAGLNLQHGGANMIWFGLDFNLTHYIQTCGRIDRQGQTETVRIIHILAADTIEQKVAFALQMKDMNQKELLRYLKYELVNKN